MNNLIIEATKSTPYIDFNAESGVLTIEGNSYPENTSNFFDEVLQWVNDYIVENNEKTIINVKLNYFNTSTSKALLDIIDIFDEKYKKGHEIVLNWFYNEDYETIQESGEEFSEDVSFPFNIIKTK
jgi:hypothetical protein